MTLSRTVALVAVAILALSLTACRNGLVEANEVNRALQESESWTAFESLPTAVQEIGVAELDGKIYVVAGIQAGGATGNLLQAYDGESDSWEVLASLPARLHHVALVALNSKLYALGGFNSFFDPVDLLFEYDPESDDWLQKSSIPSRLGSPAAAVIDDLIYVAGGNGGAGQRTLFSYDPAVDTWTQLADLPTGRNHHAAGTIDGKLYVVGGRNASSFILSTLEVYDPDANLWSSLPDMPTGRSGIAAAVVRGCLFVFGGEGNDRRVNTLGVFDENEYFNPVTNSWATADPMPFARHGIGAAVLDGRIHIPAGGPVEGFGVTSEHDAYAPPDEISCE